MWPGFNPWAVLAQTQPQAPAAADNTDDSEPDEEEEEETPVAAPVRTTKPKDPVQIQIKPPAKEVTITKPVENKPTTIQLSPTDFT